MRTYNPSGSSWTLDGQIILTHNVLGNLTQVNHVGVGTSSFTYDVGGRKTAMSDINLGNWGYGYDRQGKLTRQTDARNATICLYYDGMARLTGKHFRWDTACPASPSMSVSYGYDAGHSASNPSRGQLTSTSNSGYSKALTYNSRGLLHQETVSISGPATYVTSYGYDADLRPTTVTYPDAEIVTTGYNSMGLPSWLHSNVGGNLIDSVTYDEAGRLTQRRASHNGQFYSQTYWPWTGASSNTNGRLKEIRLGSSSGASNLLYLLYGYDSFGNIGGMNEQYNGGATNSFTFCYDAQNRLIRGYTPFNASLTCATHTGGRTYSYDSAGRLTNYEGAAMTAGGLKAHLSLPAGSYAVDSNGNLTNRLAQSLTWNHENRLESYYRATPYLYETYLYDVDGIRVRKTTNGVNTFYANRFYEQTGSAITKYYYFGGQRVAMRQGHTTPLIYLYGDHVGSTAYTTHDGGTFITEQGYWGYGRYRRGGALPTDHRFTGQKLDGSGLMYYNARYYDPDLGQFISPDTIVPDPTNLFDYNRYMYVRGNAMNATDPTGHCYFAAQAGGRGAVSTGCGGGGGGFGGAAGTTIQLAVDAVGVIVGAATVANAVQGHQESVALPEQNKAEVNGVPLVEPTTNTNATTSVPGVPSQQVLADPLTTEQGPSIVYAQPTTPTNLPRYGPFTRIESAETAQKIKESGMLWGEPMHNIFQSDFERVKAYNRPIQESDQGFEFYTDVAPDANTPRHKSYWSGPRDGVIVEAGKAIIRVVVTKINP